MSRCILAFTDLYHPTINGVTATVDLWRRSWRQRNDRMPVVYPSMRGYNPKIDEFPVRSVPVPTYTQYRLGLPMAPPGVPDADIVHVHTPFTVGITGIENGREADVPVVGSFHTLLSERVQYFITSDELAAGLKRLVRQYERWFYNAVDLVVTPSNVTRKHLQERIGIHTDVEVISNGIDTDLFRPVDSTAFAREHGFAGVDGVIGYTGRHSPEKNLLELLAAVRDTDLTLVFGGDGPARPYLEQHAAEIDADIRFLGILEQSQLPAFYSSIDVFAFPSPTETQGLVALEANACGTPVVAVDAGALQETVIDGTTGYLYPARDIDAFHHLLVRAIREQDRLREECLKHRPSNSVERSMDKLSALYDSLQC